MTHAQNDMVAQDVRAEATDFIAEAITEQFGERCPDYSEGCAVCDAWKQYDDLRAGQAEPVAWRGIVDGRTAFLCRTDDEVKRLASDYNATIEPLYATPIQAPVAPVAVKGLVWRDHRPDSFPEPAWSAQTPFGFYNLEEVSASDSPRYVVRLHAHHFVADKDSLDEAKAAAQADYEARIRSALAVPAPPVEGMVLVPKEPTQEMLFRVSSIVEHEFNRKPPGFVTHLWEHFLTAAASQGGPA